MKIQKSICLLAALSAGLSLASPASSQTPSAKRTNMLGNSVSVYDAFHNDADAVKARPSAPAPLLVTPAIYPNEFRTIDGAGNNPSNLGTAGTTVLRKTNGYTDGISSPAGASRLGARDISNKVNAQAGVFPNSSNITSFVWMWGQFTDHDLSNIRNANPAEFLNIPVPRGDPQFDAKSRGNKTLPFQRTSWTLENGVRTQIDANSQFLDASQIYGSDLSRNRTMRTQDGTGRMATSDGNFMPFNVKGLANQPQSQPGKVINPADFFLGGDVRANEQSGLISLHTVFIREHNYWADSIKAANPTFSDDDIFLRARAIVNGETQLITYRDFLPIVLGPNAIPAYTGYNSAVDPRVSNEFTTAGFRVGHTFLPPVLMRVDSRGRSRPGDIALGSTFFEPQLVTSAGIDIFMRGMAKQVPQQVDAYIIDAVRNFVFQASSGFDLASLNIQRGRDHGVGSYNQVRAAYGLSPKATFAEMTSNIDFQTRLASAYSSPDDVDAWVGGLVEDHVNGGQVGETFFAIIQDQFTRSRDGDRFWYESYLDATTLATVRAQTLGSIIKRNTAIGTEMQDDVFHTP